MDGSRGPLGKLEDAMRAPLDAAMSATFEGMAFSEVTRLAADEGDAGVLLEGPIAWARIEVRMPAAGTLMLVVEEPVARRLEQMVTGCESGEEAGRLDALAECLNALAGRWARALVPASQAIELGLPKAGQGSLWREDVDEWAVYLTDEDQRILVARVR